MSRRPEARWRRDPAADPASVPTRRAPASRSQAVYGPADLAGWTPAWRSAAPGRYPFTRGVYPTMYRGRRWTMRQFAGFGTAAETNARYRFLLEQRPGRSLGRVRHADADGPGFRRPAQPRVRSGAAAWPRTRSRTSTTLFDGIPLGDITTSMTISGPAAVAFAFFLAAAEHQGVAVGRARRHAADGHLEGVHRAEGVDLPAAAAPAADRRPDGVLRRTRARSSTRSACAATTSARPGRRRRRSWRSRSPTGSPTWSSACSAASTSNVFAPGLSFFFNAHIDFFEEIAKLPRGTADLGAVAEGALRRDGSRRHAAAVPHPDGRRLAHRPAADEQRGAHGHRGAGGGARRHAVAAHERAGRGPGAAHGGRGAKSRCERSRSSRTRRGVPDVADPLGGSYYVESHDRPMEERAEELFAEIELDGHRLACSKACLTGIERGWFQQAIAESAFREQRRLESGDLVKVGVNGVRGRVRRSASTPS